MTRTVTQPNLPKDLNKISSDIETLYRLITVASGGSTTGTAGGVLAGTYPNPTFAADMATQAELDSHKTSADHDGRYYTETEINNLLPQRIPKSIADVKGDLLVASGNDVFDRLAPGQNDLVLTTDSAAPLGVRWGAPATGGSGASRETRKVLYPDAAGFVDIADLDGNAAESYKISIVGKLAQNGGTVDKHIGIFPNYPSTSAFYSTAYDVLFQEADGRIGRNVSHRTGGTAGALGFWGGSTGWASDSDMIGNYEFRAKPRGTNRAFSGHFSSNPVANDTRKFGGFLWGDWEDRTNNVTSMRIDFGGALFTGVIIIESLTGLGLVGTNPSRRIKGRIPSSLTSGSGQGWTYTKVSTGVYDLTFDPPFAATPIITPVPLTTADRSATVDFNGLSPSYARIRVFASGTAVDHDVFFTAEDLGRGLEATMDVEPWHIVGATGQPAFENFWSPFDAAGTGLAQPSFRKTPDGKVHLKGVAKGNGSVTTVFTLPVGYRPPERELFESMGNDARARVDVYETGGVVLAAGSGVSFLTLSGISFFTD